MVVVITQIVRSWEAASADFPEGKVRSPAGTDNLTSKNAKHFRESEERKRKSKVRSCEAASADFPEVFIL